LAATGAAGAGASTPSPVGSTAGDNAARPPGASTGTAERRWPAPLHDSNLEDADAVVDASATRRKNPSDMIVIILTSRREAEAEGGGCMAAMADRRWAWPALPQMVCVRTHTTLILYILQIKELL